MVNGVVASDAVHASVDRHHEMKAYAVDSPDRFRRTRLVFTNT